MSVIAFTEGANATTVGQIEAEDDQPGPSTRKRPLEAEVEISEVLVDTTVTVRI